ncbi:Calcineurin subunit B type 1 [Auxenochlorella protothecoides]|uniref:Calcineurin subunit B type 1 n=2 Tax=Auxenochlorella protothecoides TaxID=3075 RepID=A0A087SPG0_AUXPR|nr:Calcineurin subunit B type 1 [Auxenochlorella protothecoides]KFM27614.1 Calcineurin subunit B type 1 [Auxenochlorella protothecoides]
MGNLQSLESSEKHSLSKAELERMERRLKRLGRGETELALTDFQLIPEIAGNPFLARIFQLSDRNCDGYMDSQDLRELMLRLTELRDLEAKHRFVFGIYDADGDGFVTAQDLHRQLQETNTRGLPEDKLWKVVEATMEEFDTDGDGALGFEEFVELITAVPSMG